MARAWILASCSWIGKAAGGSSRSSGGSGKAEPGGAGSANRGGIGMPGRPARAGDRRRRQSRGAIVPAEPMHRDRRMDPRLRGLAGSARTRGSSQSPDATRDQLAGRRRRPRRRHRRGRAGCGPAARLLRPARRSGRRGRGPARTAGRRQDQDQPGLAELPLEEDRDQGTDVAAAADRRAGPERRRQLVDRRGGDREDQREPERRARPGPAPAGAGPAAG